MAKSTKITLLSIILIAAIAGSINWLNIEKTRASKQELDAQALHLATLALSIQVKRPLKKFPHPEATFAPYVAQDNSQITLKNINRIMAHSTLIGMNATAMKANNTAGPRTMACAQEMAAITIEYQKDLSKCLNRNSTWRTAFTEHGQCSDIQIQPGQIPIGYPGSIKMLIEKGANDADFFIGYKRMRLPGLPHQYSFVPLKISSAPVLISAQEFENNAGKNIDALSIEGQTPIPNTFATKTNPPLFVQATSCGYPATIAWGFIRIDNLTGRSGAPIEFFQQEPKMRSILDLLRQRIREISPNFDSANDHSETRALLSEFYMPGQSKAFIYSDYPLARNVGMHSEQSALKSHLAEYMASDPDGRSQPIDGNQYRINFIPACGNNNLLGVLQISYKPGAHG